LESKNFKSIQLFFLKNARCFHRVFFVAGALGGFTTFSTFSYDTLQLLLAREFAIGVLNAVLSVCACMLFCYAGLLAGRALAG